MKLSDEEITRRRLKLQRYYREECRSEMFYIQRDMINCFRDEINKKEFGNFDNVRVDDYEMRMKFIYREMEDNCDNVVTASDSEIARMYGKIFK